MVLKIKKKYVNGNIMLDFSVKFSIALLAYLYSYLWHYLHTKYKFYRNIYLGSESFLKHATQKLFKNLASLKQTSFSISISMRKISFFITTKTKWVPRLKSPTCKSEKFGKAFYADLKFSCYTSMGKKNLFCNINDSKHIWFAIKSLPMSKDVFKPLKFST